MVSRFMKSPSLRWGLVKIHHCRQKESTCRRKYLGYFLMRTWSVSYAVWTFPWAWVWELAIPSFHPLWRARSSHIAVSLFWATNAASAFSLASSHVSMPELHLSASFWYWDVIFFASSRAMSARWWFSKASASRSFSSSVNSSAKFFSVSSLTSGSCFAQSALCMPSSIEEKK